MATTLLANHNDEPEYASAGSHANIKTGQERRQGLAIRHVYLYKCETRFPVSWWQTRRTSSAREITKQENVFSSAVGAVKGNYAINPRVFFLSADYVSERGSCFIAFPAAHVGTSHDPFDYLSHSAL